MSAIGTSETSPDVNEEFGNQLEADITRQGTRVCLGAARFLRVRGPMLVDRAGGLVRFSRNIKPTDIRR
jgi:hypothetical protein